MNFIRPAFPPVPRLDLPLLVVGVLLRPLVPLSGAECPGFPSLRFGEATFVDVGGAPAALAAADFEADGDNDLAVVDPQSGAVLILSNDGRGEVLPGGLHAVGEGVSLLIAADLDGDLRPDLALGAPLASEEKILVLTNQDASFSAPRSFPLVQAPTGIAAGDVDADGDLDLLTVSRSVASAFLSKNAGDGVFDRPIQYRIWGNDPRSVATGDFNGDGRLDVATVDSSEGYVSFLITQDQLLGTLSGTDFAVKGVALLAQDFSGDGSAEAALVGDQAAGVTLVSWISSGTVGVWDPLAAGPSRALAAGDFNQDLLPDLALANLNTGTVEIYRHHQVARSATFRIIQSVPTGGRPIALAATDLNSDGWPDLATANEDTGRVSILLNSSGLPAAEDCDGNGFQDACDLLSREVFAEGNTYTLEDGISGLIHVDFDGDAFQDLAAVCTDADTVFTLQGRGDGTFNLPRPYRIVANVPNQSSPSSPNAISPADLDLDGDLDLAVGNGGRFSGEVLGGSVTILWNVGEGRFTPSEYLPLTIQAGDLAVGDIDGDGASDLAVGYDQTGTLNFLYNQGQRRFRLVSQNTPNFVVSLALADLSRDGDLDLVTADLRGASITVLISGGGGRFLPPRHLAAGPSPVDLMVQDLNGDLSPDVIALNAFAPLVTIFTNQGEGTLTPARNFTVSERADAEPHRLAVADLNGDGRLDLATANVAAGTVSSLHGDGAGNFPSFFERSFLPTPIGLTVGDLDRDGRPDLAATSMESGELVINLNRTLPAASDCNTNGLLDRCEIAAGQAVDRNENGIPDSCEPDCNQNGLLDDLEIRDGLSPDCDGNSIPDACDTDCNGNSSPDACDLTSLTSADCNQNAIPDECDLLTDVRLDCDRNGKLDSCEIRADHWLDCDVSGILDSCEIRDGLAADRNGDGVPDSCPPRPFRRGDCDGDGSVGGGVTDAILLADYLFLGGRAPPCLSSCDADGDGLVQGRVTDVIYLLQFSFLDGQPPPPPFPECEDGGESAVVLGCAVYPGC